MNEELIPIIKEVAQQVCLYKDSIAIWVRGEEGRNRILLNARGMDVKISKMRGRTYIIKIKVDEAIRHFMR